MLLPTNFLRKFAHSADSIIDSKNQQKTDINKRSSKQKNENCKRRIAFKRFINIIHITLEIIQYYLKVQKVRWVFLFFRSKQVSEINADMIKSISWILP